MRVHLLVLLIAVSILLGCQGCGGKKTGLGNSGGPGLYGIYHNEAAWGPNDLIVFGHTPVEGGPTGLWSIKPDGTDKKFLFGDRFFLQDWSPDGQWLAGVYNRQIYKIRPDGTELTALTTEPLDKVFPAWSPDGRRIVFSIQDGTFDDWGIWTVSADGGNLLHITYSNDTNIAEEPDWSSLKKIVFVGYLNGSQTQQLIIMDETGANVRAIFDPTRYDFNTVHEPAFSPDGKKVAFSTYPTAEKDGQIWVVDSDGRHPRQLTTAGGEYPSWSPDGRRIVYKRVSYFYPGQDGLGHLWIMNADGSQKRQLTH